MQHVIKESLQDLYKCRQNRYCEKKDLNQKNHDICTDVHSVKSEYSHNETNKAARNLNYLTPTDTF